jgi:TfoX/Sxy family transcriptional regulator of competence genes
MHVGLTPGTLSPPLITSSYISDHQPSAFLLESYNSPRLASFTHSHSSASHGGMMNDELQHLKNVGKTSAQWLHAVGIHNASDLRRMGAVDAYQAVRKRGFRASKVLLYAIEAALMDIHWNDLPNDRKDALNQQVNHRMSLRKI